MVFNLPIYSPEEELHDPLFIEKQIQVFVKRDDKIHPFISGNKWRKLKYNLNYAHQLGKTNLVTFGGAWSNHILATAAAAAQFGFKSIGIIRGEEVKNPVLQMAQLFGMELQFIDRQLYKDKALYFQEHVDESNHYFIDEGGRSSLAVKGCEEIISELTQAYSHVLVSAGTGTTAAGLAVGIESQNLATKLLVVPVLKNADFILEDIKELNAPIDNINLLTEYHFGGYAKTKKELNDFIKDFVSKSGILIEPTYTGKLVYGMFDLIKKDYFPKGSRILFVHTGGLTGLLGHLDKMNLD